MQLPASWFGPAIIMGIWGALLIGVCIYSAWKRRREDAERLEEEPSDRRIAEEWDQGSVAERQARPTRFRCLKCGEYITGGKSVCTQCGAKQKRCMVCQQFIGQEELYNKCPHCKQLAHRVHLLEWIKVKGTCPYCKEKLPKDQLV